MTNIWQFIGIGLGIFSTIVILSLLAEATIYKKQERIPPAALLLMAAAITAVIMFFN